MQIDVLNPDPRNLAPALVTAPNMFDALAQARSSVRAGASHRRGPGHRAGRHVLTSSAGDCARSHPPTGHSGGQSGVGSHDASGVGPHDGSDVGSNGGSGVDSHRRSGAPGRTFHRGPVAADTFHRGPSAFSGAVETFHDGPSAFSGAANTFHRGLWHRLTFSPAVRSRFFGVVDISTNPAALDAQLVRWFSAPPTGGSGSQSSRRRWTCSPASPPARPVATLHPARALPRAPAPYPARRAPRVGSVGSSLPGRGQQASSGIFGHFPRPSCGVSGISTIFPSLPALVRAGGRARDFRPPDARHFLPAVTAASASARRCSAA